jgi:hypothetical protein
VSQERYNRSSVYDPLRLPVNSNPNRRSIYFFDFDGLERKTLTRESEVSRQDACFDPSKQIVYRTLSCDSPDNNTRTPEEAP